MTGKPEFIRWWIFGTAALMLLAAGLVGFTRFATPRVRIAQARAELGRLQRALDGFRTFHHAWPRAKSPTEFLEALMGRRDASGRKTDVLWFVAKERFNFRSADPDAPNAAIMDPWGQPYHYVCRIAPDGAVSGYILFSAGPDGKASDPARWAKGANGTAPEDADNLWVGSETAEPQG